MARARAQGHGQEHKQGLGLGLGLGLAELRRSANIVPMAAWGVFCDGVRHAWSGPDVIHRGVYHIWRLGRVIVVCFCCPWCMIFDP